MGIFNKKEKEHKNEDEIKSEDKANLEKNSNTEESEFLKAFNEINLEDQNKESSTNENKNDNLANKKQEEKKEVVVNNSNREKEDSQKKSKKEKKDYTTYNPILDMKFWFKLIGGVVLLVFSLAMLFQKDLRERVCVGIFGGIVAVFAVYRIYPTFKYEKGNWVKLLCIIEIIVDLVIGVVLAIGGFNFSESGKDLAEFTSKNFHYLLGFVFYLRGIVYTLSTIIFKQNSNIKNYVVNILCLSFGAYVFASDNFLITALGWALVVLALGSSAYLLVEGGIDYNNYRNHNEQHKRKVEQKKKEKEQKKREKETLKIEKGETPKDKQSEKEEKIIIPDEKGNDQKQDIC